MKIFIDVLSDELLDACKTDLISNKIKENVWGSSSFRWNPHLLENIDGSCITTPITNKSIIKRLEDELSVVFKKYNYNSLSFNYYIWDSYSGISGHTDKNHVFGATLYLTNSDVCDGGIFMWKSEEEEQSEIDIFRCVVPKENMLTVNDQAQTHTVTPISPHAKDYRCTIQIFAS
tara:strand:+ start:430 stop:954 length:525 start_codon:yes stop_codon:yes gene_type:complete